MHRRHRFGARSTPRTARLATLVVAAIATLAMLVGGAGAQSRSLGAAESFAVLAGATVTNVVNSGTVIHGDLGVFPGTAITGAPQVNGEIHAGDDVAREAQTSARATYTTLEPLPCTQTLPGIVGNLTLTAGVYCFTSDALLTGTLTLNFQGNPDSEFIFKVGTQLTTASSSVVELVNAPNACNVFWQIGSSAVLGTNSVFVGTLLADQSITAANGVRVTGRLLALVGQVSLDNNTITRPTCATTTTTAGSGTTTTPDGSGATTTTPDAGATTTSTPGVAPVGTTTSTPGGSATTTSTPGGSGATTTTPGGSGATTTTPGGSGATTTTPGGSGATTTTPGGSGATTTTPGGSGATTTTPGGSGATTTTPGGSGATSTTTAGSGGPGSGTTTTRVGSGSAARLPRTGANDVAPTTAGALLVIMLGGWMLVVSRRGSAR